MDKLPLEQWFQVFERVEKFADVSLVCHQWHAIVKRGRIKRSTEAHETLLMMAKEYHPCEKCCLENSQCAGDRIGYFGWLYSQLIDSLQSQGLRPCPSTLPRLLVQINYTKKLFERFEKQAAYFESAVGASSQMECQAAKLMTLELMFCTANPAIAFIYAQFFFLIASAHFPLLYQL
jgi:hypothetical protein